MFRFKVIIFLLVAPMFSYARAVVVVAKGSTVPHLTKDEVRRIYLGKLQTLDDGGRLRPADMAPGDELRSEFYRDVVGKNEEQLRTLRSIQLFTGRARPPVVFQAPGKLKAWILSTEGGIGYLPKDQVDPRLRIVYP